MPWTRRAVHVAAAAGLSFAVGLLLADWVVVQCLVFALALLLAFHWVAATIGEGAFGCLEYPLVGVCATVFVAAAGWFAFMVPWQRPVSWLLAVMPALPHGVVSLSRLAADGRR